MDPWRQVYGTAPGLLRKFQVMQGGRTHTGHPLQGIVSSSNPQDRCSAGHVEYLKVPLQLKCWQNLFLLTPDTLASTSSLESLVVSSTHKSTKSLCFAD